MTWAPALLLWLCFPWTLFDYISSKRQMITWNRFNLLKLTITSVLAIVGAAHAIYVIVRWAQRGDLNDPTSAELLSTIISFFTYCLLVVFVHLQRLYGFVNGGAIWFYLFFQIIFTALSIPTYLQNPEHYDSTEQILVYLELGIFVVLFVVTSFPDQVPNLNELLSSSSLYGHDADGYLIANDDEAEEGDGEKVTKKKKKICPKETASFPSKLSFWWFNSLAFLGFRRPLTVDDLWQIRRVDRATSLFARFNTFWRHKSFTGNDADSKGAKQTKVFSGKPERMNSTSESYEDSKKHSYSMSDYNQLSSNGNHTTEDAESDFSNVEPPPKINVMSLLAKQFWRYFIFPSSARFITDNLQLVNPIVMK